MDIWKLNLQRLRRLNEKSEDKRPLEIVDSAVLEFAEFQFEASNHRGHGQWNGRQIRNAFQVARSLAYYDALTEAEETSHIPSNEPALPAVLQVKYFRMMHEITESFDHYMLEVFSGLNDRDLALEMEHRADNWKGDRWNRSLQAREDHDDQYNGYNARSPFDLGPRQDSAGRPRSTSHQGSRPSLAVPGTLQRNSPASIGPPFAAGYDETNTEDKESRLLRPISPKSGQRQPSNSYEGPNMDFRGTLLSEDEYSFQSSMSNQRFAPSFASPESRTFGRSGGNSFRRDARSQSGFDANQGYRMDRNEHGKRERS
jgi:hypothetical protein